MCAANPFRVQTIAGNDDLRVETTPGLKLANAFSVKWNQRLSPKMDQRLQRNWPKAINNSAFKIAAPAAPRIVL